MHSLEIHQFIRQMISIFYRIGFWHRGDEATINELGLKSFYCIYQFLFTISLAVAAVTNEDSDDCVFLASASVMVFVVSGKLWLLIWKQKRILDLLHRICNFSIRYDDDLIFVNKKLRGFVNFVIFASIVAYVIGLCEAVVEPLFGSERTLFIKVAFPLDWRHDDFAYWLATAFLLTEIFLFITACLSNVVIWYLMFDCSLRYQVLGSELRKMGQMNEVKSRQILEKAKQNLFFRDLTTLIDTHQHIRELTKDLECFLSKLFFLQFSTSAMCIAGTIYFLAFGVGNKIMEIGIYAFELMYNIADIFSITYFGNEITLSSDSLSYCLFESNWFEQPQSTKNCVLIFGEYLKRPHTIIVGGLYPLTLETFTRILNSAYSMLNILKNTKQ